MSSGFDLSSVFPSSILPSAPSPIGGAGGHRAVGGVGGYEAYQAPVAPAQSPPPMQPFGIGMGGGADVMRIPTYQNQIGMGTPAHGNIFGGGANISEEGAMSWWDKLKSNIDKDFLTAALGSLGDMGGGASRSGGGGGGGGGARVGGNVKPTGLMSPTLPDIPAQAPNPGFYTLLPRQQKDRYSGGF